MTDATAAAVEPPLPPSSPLPSRAAGGADALEQRVRLELQAQAYDAVTVPVLSGVPFSLLLAAVFAREGAYLTVGLWLALKLAMALWRVVDVRLYRADPERHLRSRHWQKRLLWLLWLDSLCWASLVPVFGPHADDLLGTSLLMCGVLGVTSIGVFTTFMQLTAMRLFCVTMLTPMGLYFLLEGTLTGTVIAIGCLIYGVVLYHEAQRSHHWLREMLQLRYQQAALAEERADALAQAQASAQAKDRFLATVSHEMRTPLHGILGAADLMRVDDGPEAADDDERLRQRRWRTDTVLRSARHLDGVISDLLDMSALEFQRLTLRAVPVSVRELLDEVTALHRTLAQAKGLALQLHVAPEVPATALLDPARVRQVLHNLLGNAVKFTAQGEVSLQVRAGAAHTLVFDVRDTGPGIAPQDQQRIFDAFERAGQVGQAAGTGLGLAISRRLADAMGGSLHGISVPGQGSCFTFTLPVTVLGSAALATATASREGGPADAAALQPGQELAGRHVLVVDDNEVNALLACQMLRHLGVRTSVAEHGEAALQRMRDGGLDAVLMDCQMPTMDGFEATRRWRALESAQGAGRGRLPIVGLTAFAAASDRRACLDAGMDEHLAKPYAFEALAGMLRRVVAQAG